MKSTGIVRQMDSLRRIVIPMEVRKTMDIREGDGLEIYTEGESIILKKYAPGCTFCGNIEDDMQIFKGKNICSACKVDIKK